MSAIGCLLKIARASMDGHFEQERARLRSGVVAPPGREPPGLGLALRGRDIDGDGTLDFCAARPAGLERGWEGSADIQSLLAGQTTRLAETVVRPFGLLAAFGLSWPGAASPRSSPPL